MPFFKSLLLSLIAFTLYSFKVEAIDETESLRQRSHQQDTFTNVSFDFAGKRGNSETEQFAIGLYHSKREDEHFGFVMATREYAESNGLKSSNSAFIHVRYNYYVQPTSALELFAQSNVDDFRSLESRNLVGLSYRNELSNNQALGIGLFNEWERYSVNDDSKRFIQLRANIYWVYHQDITKTATIANTLYYQPNTSGISDWRAFNKLSIRSSVSQHVYMNFGVLIEHDSQPVLSVDDTDIKYSAGFEFEF